jgi:DNA-binding winged helix-turn-helix (wHTH) protein/TolB-like protein/Tfp pilus assembly protein PilF
MLTSISKVLHFGRFTLDLGRFLLLADGREVALRRQSFDVLRHLAERPGEIVSRDDLVAAVWSVPPARPEDSVAQCIKEIRRALGGEARTVVRTVSGRGYQLVAAVTVVEEAAPAPPPPLEPASVATPDREARPAAGSVAPGPALAERGGPLPWQRALIAALLLTTVLVSVGWLVWQRLGPDPPAVLAMMASPSVAVLPFTADGAEPDLVGAARSFSDDVTLEIARQVYAPLVTLRSAAGYGNDVDPRVLGRRLDARYLLLGRLRRQGDAHLVSVRGIEAETGRQLWAHAFRFGPEERKYALARLAGLLGVHVLSLESHRPPPAEPEAGHYAIRAWDALDYVRNATGSAEALALTEKAIALEPDSVPALLAYAWAHIAFVQVARLLPDEREDHLGEAQEALDRAVALAPREPAVLHRRAQLLRMQGNPAGAIAALERALALSPYFSLVHAELGRSKVDMGLAHEAIAHIEEAMRIHPGHNSLVVWQRWAGLAAAHAGNYAKAAEWLQKAQRTKPGAIGNVLWLAVAYAGLGREAEGRALVDRALSEGRNLSIARWRRRYPPGSGVLAEQRKRIEELLRRLGVAEAKKWPDADKRGAAERAGNSKLAAVRKPGRPRARGAFDGTWQVRRVGPGCRRGDKTFEIQVIEGAVSGRVGAGPISGTVSSSGRLAFEHLSSSGDGVSLHYSAALEGASGSGTFEYPNHPCRGTIALRRGGPRPEPAKDR